MFLASLVFSHAALSETIHVTVDGLDREAIVVRPTVGTGAAPVVLCFHGHGGSAAMVLRRYGVEKAWPEAIVVYMQGLARKTVNDPEGTRRGWLNVPGLNNPDVAYANAIRDKVISDYNGEKSKVFAMGHSNGGYFSYALWATEPDDFKAFGIFAGAGAAVMNLKPKPAFIAIGDNDPIVKPAMQNNSLKKVLSVDGLSGDGQKTGDNLIQWKGPNEVEEWTHHGGHAFQADAVPEMVALFKRALG